MTQEASTLSKALSMGVKIICNVFLLAIFLVLIGVIWRFCVLLFLVGYDSIP